MIKLLFHGGYIKGLGSEGSMSRGRYSPQEAHHISATCPFNDMFVFCMSFSCRISDEKPRPHNRDQDDDSQESKAWEEAASKSW